MLRHMLTNGPYIAIPVDKDQGYNEQRHISQQILNSDKISEKDSEPNEECPVGPSILEKYIMYLDLIA